jgi:diaminopimelate decarboxylase
MNLAETIIRTWYKTGSEGLCVDGIPVSEIAERYGTPCYLYSPGIFREKAARLLRAIPVAELYYSLKANPTPAVIRTFVDIGAGLEIASAGELALALRCGCPPSRIIFAGPGKQEHELNAGIKAGIGEFHVESFTEIDRLQMLARSAGACVPVAVRVNAAEISKSGAIVMSGGSSPFGIDEERVAEAIETIVRSPHLHFAGLHFYAGTQMLESDVIIDVYSNCIECASALARATGQSPGTIDFGGGFGVPYFEKDRELDIDALGTDLKPLLREARQKTGLSDTRFIIEPGRYLTAEGGLYVTRISDIKESRGAMFLILDGGMHHNIGPAGHFGQLIKRNSPIVIANRTGEPSDAVYTIVGPLCTPLDTMGRNVSLPHAQIGDVVVFLQAGAYSRTASPLQFLSHPEPIELCIDNGTVSIARKRGGQQNLFRGTPFDES